MKNKLYHPSKGVIELKGKTFSPLNGVQPQYMDGKGKPHKLDGSEVPFSEVEAMLKEKKQHDMQKELLAKFDEMEEFVEEKKGEEKQAEKQAHQEEMKRKHSEVVQEIKEASSVIAEAVKAIPETVIPEFPDHLDEQKKWKEEIVEAIKESKVEIPQEDYSAIVEAVGKIKFPEVKIPEPKDYTKILEEIKKALPENTDMSGVISAIQSIPQFQIPESLISDNRIKVEVDRISMGGGSFDTSLLSKEATQQSVLNALGSLSTALGGAPAQSIKESDVSDNLLYKGTNTSSSAAESDATWQITKYTYETGITKTKTLTGSWTNRVALFA